MNTRSEPRTLQQALERLSGASGGTGAPPGILAGGTDFYPALRDRAPPVDVLDVTRIAGLGGIARDTDGWRIGAATTWSELIGAPLPAAFDGLKGAARQIGSVQIQNAATLGGNLCNASPAADGVPALLALDARVELASGGGTRSLPLAEFITGVRRTARRADELLVAIRVPEHPAGSVGVFGKLGTRAYLVISTAMVAVTLLPGPTGRVARARVAVGACSAVATRLPTLEAALAGWRPGTDDPGPALAAERFAPLAPIDDIRGSAEYRLEAVRELLRRLLDECADAMAAARTETDR